MSSQQKSQIPPIRQEFKEQTEIAAPKFIEAMEVRGWRPIYDLFKTLCFWKHARTDIILPHHECSVHFMIAGDTPTPF